MSLYRIFMPNAVEAFCVIKYSIFPRPMMAQRKSRAGCVLRLRYILCASVNRAGEALRAAVADRRRDGR